MNDEGKKLLLTLEYPPDIGGIATYYASIAKSDKRISIMHFTGLKKKCMWATVIPRVLNKIKKEEINHIQIGHILPLGYIGIIAKWFRGISYSVYIHGLDVLQKNLTPWKLYWIKKILKEACVIIANSHYVKNQTVKKYSIQPKKIHVRYPNVDVKKIEQLSALQEPIKKPYDSCALLSVGRLVRRKGFDTTIKAVAYLKKMNPCLNITYWIIGKGKDEKHLKFLINALELEESVHLLGSIPTPELYRYFKACDVFIMPSYELNGDVEGFGIVFLEAGVFKKPVIGGNSGGIPEAVIDGVTGFLADGTNPKDVAQKIYSLITDTYKKKAMGEAGYERVKNAFSP